MIDGWSWSEIHDAVEWIVRIGMLGVLPFRRTPAASRSWLLLIFFLPLPGLLLFMAIGDPKFPQWRLKLFADMEPLRVSLKRRLNYTGEPNEAMRLAERLGNLPPVSGNGAELMTDYPAVIDRLIRDIDAASRSVRIVSYIFADDPTGLRVIDALARASARGVACHVLIDPVGSHRWMKRTVRRLQDAGVETRAALPMRLLRKWTRRDMRNHRKLFLIDDGIGYVGSQNIVDADFRKRITNRELVVRVSGPVVAEMQAVFLSDWYLETRVLLEPEVAIAPHAGVADLQLLPSGADSGTGAYLAMLVWLIQCSQRRVAIVTPYFIPDEGLLVAVRVAVLRGVRVEVVVSAMVDQPLVHLAQCSYYDELLASGAAIYRYKDYLLHAKLVLVDDDLAIVGSSNADIRSFQLNEEVSLLLHGSEQVLQTEQVVDQFLANSTPLHAEEWRRRGFARRFLQNIARQVSPLL
jgi:cardiolipin synthase